MRLIKYLKVKNIEKVIQEVGSIDLLVVLELIEAGFTLEGLNVPDVKKSGWISGLQRRGLLSDSGQITLEGHTILSILDQDLGRNTLKKTATEERDENFIKWWNNYPSNNSFTYGGKQFPGIRKMRIQQKECEVLFYKLINEEGFTAEDIIQGTINHINLVKKISYGIKENKMTYVPASPRYLREKVFADYINKEEEKSEPTNKDFEI